MIIDITGNPYIMLDIFIIVFIFYFRKSLFKLTNKRVIIRIIIFTSLSILVLLAALPPFASDSPPVINLLFSN